MVGFGKPQILLCMPNCRAIEPEVAQSFWSPSFPADLRVVDIVRRELHSSSFLPGNFNSILARALDLRDEGKVTHIAMQHDDVSPPGWWLSDLYHELILRNAEVMSAVIAIKSKDRHEGKTSTAVGRLDDPWRIVRHIRVEDLPDLPATFCTKHVAKEPDEILLINTGLWIADLHAPWLDEFEGFTTHARIVRHENHRESQWRTEDWEWSRFLATQQARYYATTRVAAEHLGVDSWKIR